MSQDPQANKRNAMAFYELMFSQCRARQAIEQYAGEVYIQHNPEVGNGKEAFIAYFERMAVEYLEKPFPLSVQWQRMTSWCCTAIKSGRVIWNTLGSTSFVLMTTERLLSIGMYYKSSLKHQPTTIRCSNVVP